MLVICYFILIPKHIFIIKNPLAIKEEEKWEEVAVLIDLEDSRADVFLVGGIHLLMTQKGREDIAKPVMLLSIALEGVYADLQHLV